MSSVKKNEDLKSLNISVIKDAEETVIKINNC